MVDEIKETWYRKDDPNKRYPQTTKRLKINFPYDADVQNQLKNALRVFPTEVGTMGIRLGEYLLRKHHFSYRNLMEFMTH
jgi:hypothetical protein